MRKEKKLPRDLYEAELYELQVQLVQMVDWVKRTGARVAVVFEGRDAAGKGGVIKRINEYVSPRVVRTVALPAPSDREQTEWYFQRYIAHLPAAGEVVLFDRSWYNRAGVEKVLGFCTADEHQRFLRQCPTFERMLVDDGIILLKYWFSVSEKEQAKRFEARDRRPAQAVEALADRPLLAQPLGRLLARQGRDVRPHRHPRGPLARGRVRRQAQRPDQLHLPPAQEHPLRARGADRG